MDFDLKTAIQFAHIARTRSFSRSAAELRVSQPWLSTRIRQLEERLGCNLFERTTRRIRLTPEGDQLLAAAEALAASATEFEMVARGLRDHPRARLRIGTPPYGFMFPQRIELVESFASRTQTIVELDIGWTHRLIERLQRSELDAAFVIEPFDTSGLEILPVATMAFMIIARSDDRLANRRSLRPADLAGRRIGAFTRDLNPGVFDMYYPPLVAAGAAVVELPEVRRALLMADDQRDALVLGSLQAAPVTAGPDGTGLVRLPLRDAPTLNFLLVRRSKANSRTCQRFWDMARTGG
ncbi:LysR family transcriptional regulator [Vineibacter terrae]|uniref:LysR family transcriptional regulator n=1 Tax=Vineibacter terrae TaxID=2586908 RepID=UPI002E34F697|nr:LysR family transcriptional regulator [Vineibacter terrae]HEX2891488.1 LysR family transcriptional regulator [Vineibacter terrae]